ncbi:hypothetical protein BDZ45DRAFT_697187 [Acephala macrosclerotiorum]|nr:hypothetical protein BDZ45DRAFT_697187 [Acephala macrosclerotiorum]
MPGNSSQPWGLILPGRAATPSEGAAQTYQRVGPHGTQKTRTFDNGTCLTFGPQGKDLVDEFNLYEHPFSDQIVLIDNTVRDCRAERIRYERSGMASFREDKGEVVFPKDDPFNNFRQSQLPFEPMNAPKVQIESGTYIQVPSIHASCSSLRSVYSTQNKADIKGDSHWSYGSDTRFGVTCKPPEGFTQRFRPKSGEGGPAFRHNGEKTYSKYDLDSKDDRAKNEKYRPRPPRHVRMEAERHRIAKEKVMEEVFQKQMQVVHGSKRGDGGASSRIRAAEFAHGYTGYMGTGLQHPVPIKAQLSDQLFIEQLLMQQSGGERANISDEEGTPVQRPAQQGYLSQAHGQHEHSHHSHRRGTPFEPPGLENGRQTNSSRVLVSNGAFHANHGPVTGYPPGFGPPPPLPHPMNTHFQAGMCMPVAELEAIVPNNFVSAEPANPRLSRQRSGRGRDQALTDQDMANREFAKLLDEQNAISRQRGDAVLGGDIMSGDAVAMQHFHIPVDVHVHPPTPRHNNKESMFPNDRDIRNATAPDAMGSKPEAAYQEDQQSRLMTPIDWNIRKAGTLNLPDSHSPVVFAQSEPVSPKMMVIDNPTVRRVSWQSNQTENSQINLPIGVRKRDGESRPQTLSRQISMQNRISGFNLTAGAGLQTSVSDPGSPRLLLGWDKMIYEMPRNRVESPTTKAKTMD